MNDLWWQLPEPARFVKRLVQDFHDGKNVVIGLPEHAPAQLTAAVRAQVTHTERRFWEVLSLSGPLSARPLDLLFTRFGTNAAPGAVRNAATLVELSSLTAHLIWIEGMTTALWPAWRSFLTEYAHVCRSQPQAIRPVFGVSVVGALAPNMPASDTCLSTHQWQGAVDQLDMLLYASSIFPNRRIAATQRRVVIAMVAALALWDPDVCDCLIRASPHDLARPAAVLRDLAGRRGWTERRNPTLSWEHGTVAIIDGRKHVHAALLALHDPDKELQARIWRAQVGVIFPLVEEKRRDLIATLRPMLGVPFATSFGIVEDLCDLEIGHIESQLIASGVPIAPGTRQLIQRLRQIRNALSHFEPVSLDLLSF